MKHFRIRIDDDEQRPHAITEVTRRGRVVCLRNHEFIVPEPALTFLDGIRTEYVLIGEDDPETTLRKIRDSLAAA